MKNFFGPVGNKVVHNQHGPTLQVMASTICLTVCWLRMEPYHTHEMTMIPIRIFTLAAMVEEVAWDQSSLQSLCKPLTNQSDTNHYHNSILRHSKSR